MRQANAERTLTYSAQDYLKSIYELTTGGGAASTSAIAARLRISPASVTGMLQKLAAAKPALVWYKKHQGARLTAPGKRAALQVIRHHRLMETWLVQTLGYSWDQVHGEAETLEHAVSEDLEKRISAALGNPIRDPHGEPIPSEDLVMPDDWSISLSELRVGEHATVRRVQSDDMAALKHLDKLGLRLGAHVVALSVSEYDQAMLVRIGGAGGAVTVGPATTSRVFVEPTRSARERKQDTSDE